MENQPQKTCSIDRLVTHPKLVAATLAGSKTQQRRDASMPGPEKHLNWKGLLLL